VSDVYAGTTLRRLRFRWVVVSAVAAVATALAYELFADRFATDLARRWLAVTALVLAYELALLWRFLPRNRDHDDEGLSPSFGPATLLTVVRGVLVAFLAGFLLLPQPTESLVWLPAALYGAAASLDYVDGVVARLTGHVTELGERLDVEIDALGILIAPLLAVVYGQLPVWYLSAGVARYLFVAGKRYRRSAGKPVHDLPPQTVSRTLAGVQMAFLALVLSPLLTPPEATLVAVVVLVPFLANFLRDWWYLTGRLPR
jgi:CDP-diacylglycerol--glycerol-3-phosphate 3-phosphatidyltransferase